jgi:predicted membrane protein DUF2231
MSTVNGLPAHILLVHAVVVLLPLAAFLLVLTAVWPAARRRLAGPNALLAIGVLILTPITTEAGEWLEQRVGSTELVRQHAELGDLALFIALPIAVLAAVVWWRQREATEGTTRLGGRTWLAPRSLAVTRVIAVLAILAGLAGAVGTYRIGDSGAKAAWTGNFDETPQQPR